VARRFHGLAVFLAALAPGCELLTDFSPRPGDGGTDHLVPGDDGGTDRPDTGGLFCDDSAVCPSGMNLLGCGQFVMGSEAGEGDSDELPEHVVTLSAFCIDDSEVTNGAYAECVRVAVCSQPRDLNSVTRRPYYGVETYRSYPVLNVDWVQAQTYCEWVGKRLPTEAEWEKAARGGCEMSAPGGCGAEDERTYPWGEDPPTCTLANFYGCVTDSDYVGARLAGSGPYGTKDLAGNVYEWVADWYDPGAYAACGGGGCIDPQGPETGGERVFRGGSWESTVGYLRTANRFRQVPGYSDGHLGFRCAASLH
jgi:formylglycine-generating enzyme required for sulfatase activity